MTVDHPQFGLMCEICFTGLTESDCVVDTDGQRWDLCKGDCARQAGIAEAVSGVGLHTPTGGATTPRPGTKGTRA